MSDCIFCKIISGEIPAKKIYENNLVVAFLDVNPISYGHTLIIPKAHFSNLSECNEEYLSNIIISANKISNLFLKNCSKIEGFNYLSNSGKIAGQIIDHFHFHLIPKYNENSGFNVNSKKDEKSFHEINFLDKIIIN